MYIYKIILIIKNKISPTKKDKIKPINKGIINGIFGVTQIFLIPFFSNLA
jgi:hypothetical protein